MWRCLSRLTSHRFWKDAIFRTHPSGRLPGVTDSTMIRTRSGYAGGLNAPDFALVSTAAITYTWLERRSNKLSCKDRLIAMLGERRTLYEIQPVCLAHNGTYRSRVFFLPLNPVPLAQLEDYPLSSRQLDLNLTLHNLPLPSNIRQLALHLPTHIFNS